MAPIQQANRMARFRICRHYATQLVFSNTCHAQRRIHTIGTSRDAFQYLNGTAITVSSPRQKSRPLSQDSSPSLSNQLRSLMRRLSHSVVVCTASQPTPNGSIPRAMTMSSFTSLALTPRPLVTFNVKAPSSTLDAVIASRSFNIHVLEGDAHGARIAEWFTKGNFQSNLFRAPQSDWQCILRDGEPPVLEGQGILSRVRCSLLSDGESYEKGVVRISDHVVILGEVQEVVAGNLSEDFALTYADSKYRTKGDVIQKHTEVDNKE